MMKRQLIRFHFLLLGLNLALLLIACILINFYPDVLPSHPGRYFVIFLSIILVVIFSIFTKKTTANLRKWSLFGFASALAMILWGYLGEDPFAAQRVLFGFCLAFGSICAFVDSFLLNSPSKQAKR